MTIKEFIFATTKKIAENLTSVKVWLFLGPFSLSISFASRIINSILENIDRLKAVASPEAFLYIEKFHAQLIEVLAAWGTFNLSLIGTIIVAREIFKVAKIKNKEDSSDMNV